MGPAMGAERADNLPGGDPDAFLRSDKLRRRNRRVGLIVLLIVLALMGGTVLYVAFLGGANMLPAASAVRRGGGSG